MKIDTPYSEVARLRDFLEDCIGKVSAFQASFVDDWDQLSLDFCETLHSLHHLHDSLHRSWVVNSLWLSSNKTNKGTKHEKKNKTN